MKHEMTLTKVCRLVLVPIVGLSLAAGISILHTGKVFAMSLEGLTERLPAATAGSERESGLQSRRSSRKRTKRRHPCDSSIPTVGIGTVTMSADVASAYRAEDLRFGNPVKTVTPPYPEKARIDRLGGEIAVELVLSELGEVVSSKSVVGDPLLLDAVLRVAKGWKFTPTVLKEMPEQRVSVVARITFVFEL